MSRNANCPDRAINSLSVMQSRHDAQNAQWKTSIILRDGSKGLLSKAFS